MIRHFDEAHGKEKYLHVDLTREWLQDPKIASVTKQSLTVQIRKFYRKNRSELPKERLSFEVSSTEAERAVTLMAIQTSEMRSLIMRGNTLERAVLLTCFHGALGISEFDAFNKGGYTEEFAKRLNNEEIPLKITMIRKKTLKAGSKPYYTFLHRDAIDYRKMWLKEREKLTGKPIQFGEPIFISKNKKTGEFAPVEMWTVERIMRSLSQEVGLEKRKI